MLLRHLTWLLAASIVFAAVPASAEPRFCVTSDALLFGNCAVGSVSQAIAMVSNCGDAPWSFTSVIAHPATSAQFRVDSGCATGLVLAPGDACGITVTFAPTQTGEVSGALWLYNTTATPDQLVTFYGRGIDASAGTASLTFAPASADFGVQAVGSQAGPLVVALRNSGNAPLIPSALVLNGADPYDFQSVSYGDPADCAVGRAIAAGASCSLNLFFRPASAGSRSAQLVVDAPQLASLATLPITGTGAADPGAGSVEVIEFAHPAEAAALDAGIPSGWARTGAHFRARPRDAATVAIDPPVCRFFGVPGVGPNSHFFTVDPAECVAVKADPHWTYEGIAFRVPPPAGGACPPGYVTVTRLWWPGADPTQTRHRYVVDPSLIDPMRASGWVLEGPVFCGLP